LNKKIVSMFLAVLLVSGCGGMSTGVSIGDKEIKASEIQKSVDEILTARNSTDTSQMQLVEGPELLRTQAQFVIISNLLDQIAIDKKLDITQADVGARKADIIASIGGEGELPKALVGASLAASNFDAYLRILIISERLNTDLTATGMPQEQATEEVTKLVTLTASKLGVKVNTKYGKWNPATASIEIGDATGGAVTPLP
jgi:hypothetical protein